MPIARLKKADEVFITATGGGIMPVTKLYGEPVGDGHPGPLTGRLSKLYWEKNNDPAWTTPVAG